MQESGKQSQDVAAVVEALGALEIETPSWGYGNSGTRFKVFPWPGAARNLREKLEDAAQVHALTGACPSVAVHIPWGVEGDRRGVAAPPSPPGVRSWAMQSN